MEVLRVCDNHFIFTSLSVQAYSVGTHSHRVREGIVLTTVSLQTLELLGNLTKPRKREGYL